MKWKNLTAKVTGISMLSMLLISTTVFATRVESPLQSTTVNGYKYNFSSRLDLEVFTPNTNYVKAFTAIFSDNGVSVPAGYMGGQARLYNSAGVLKNSSSTQYSSSAAQNFTILGDQFFTEDTYYSQGKVQFYTGNGYVGVDVNQSPKVILKNKTSFSKTNELPDDLKLQEEYAVNNNGETYGSALLESKIGEEPDLISAVGTNGVQGYVKAEELFPLPTSLQDGNSNDDIVVISLYDQNGKTVIGDFELKGDSIVENPVNN